MYFENIVGKVDTDVKLHFGNMWQKEVLFIPFPNDKFYSSKLKVFSDNNFKFDKNGKNFFKRVEKTVGKGEIARYDQFLLFPQSFQKTCTADT